ncbi:LysR family transcriptional regulator [Chimaeribacter californicus]|uniref:LysR family transcriptional regulator n=1 Tax=Chimaeribacter californicus TaxID=2060067 RepID=A0A2N5E242_9GAMM|nr:LysR family transcriptional regulator [Chimaeribacter californicus]PLR34653.1 LysR family transcriptional regulator [Chimaeribacter californicus]
MRYSPEALNAFVQTAGSGSFSAAARALGKSQSTISTAIANLEIDLGLLLFDRSGRKPRLTDAGQRVLAQAQEILQAAQRLDELALRLADHVEPRLSMATSDFWQADHHELLLRRFSERYPDIEFECMIAEDEDVLALLQQGRAHLGIIRSQAQLPGDIAMSRLQIKPEIAVWLHQSHPLANQPQVTMDQLKTVRQLRLNTWLDNSRQQVAGRVWSAPSYLLLLEMAEQGFGWAILPRWLVQQFGHHVLRELPVPGWPQQITVDAVWSRVAPPGPAGQWMRDQLCAQRAEETGPGS